MQIPCKSAKCEIKKNRRKEDLYIFSKKQKKIPRNSHSQAKFQEQKQFSEKDLRKKTTQKKKKQKSRTVDFIFVQKVVDSTSTSRTFGIFSTKVECDFLNKQKSNLRLFFAKS